MRAISWAPYNVDYDEEIAGGKKPFEIFGKEGEGTQQMKGGKRKWKMTKK